VADLTEITAGLEFPEGPVAMSDGSVIVTEIQGGRLTRVAPDGSKDVVAATGGGPNGAAIGPDGKLYVANNGGSFQYVDMGGLNFPHQPPPESWKGGRIERVDIEAGEVDVLYEECDGNPLRGPNDLVFDAHGGFWFTDHGVRLERSSDRTGIYYAQPDGSSIREAIFPMDAPNGIGLSPDGTRLYVAETFANSVWWWKVTGPGEVEEVPGIFPHGGTLLYSPGGLQGFDSLGVDSEGHVCVATLVNGGISVVDGESGELADFVQTPDDILCTNICWGGEDLTTAYLTLSGTGRLVSTVWPRPGLALAHSA
jgi:gluconolactonase